MIKKNIDIMEVCPRDGWQNLHEIISTEQKIYFIDKMLAAGIQKLQVASFVHPKAVPQMRDASEVVRAIVKKYPDKDLSALVPNLYGAKVAVECGLSEVSYVVSVSETHNMKNIGRTHEQSFAELEKIRKEYPDLKITMGCATTFGCPYEGEFSLDRILWFLERGVKLGVDKIELSDTIGLSYPTKIEQTFSTVKKEFPNIYLMAHLHDTRNNGVLNSWLAAQCGADMIHTALGGMGGCPFAPGASGNTSTEDMVYLLSKCGIETGIDFDKILDAAKEMFRMIKGNYSGHQIRIGSVACKL
jgi:hydroxymethylglutaryl-CoA lyase